MSILCRSTNDLTNNNNINLKRIKYIGTNSPSVCARRTKACDPLLRITQGWPRFVTGIGIRNQFCVLPTDRKTLSLVYHKWNRWHNCQQHYRSFETSSESRLVFEVEFIFRQLMMPSEKLQNIYYKTTISSDATYIITDRKFRFC